MPRPIDGANLIEYLNTVVLPGLPKDKPEYARGKRHLVYTLTNLIISGAFDPTPPVQPEMEPGKTRVRHIDKKYAPYGIGIVKEISKSGKQAYVYWPEYDKKHFKWGPPTPSYYRLDKLEVIQPETGEVITDDSTT